MMRLFLPDPTARRLRVPLDSIPKERREGVRREFLARVRTDLELAFPKSLGFAHGADAQLVAVARGRWRGVSVSVTGGADSPDGEVAVAAMIPALEKAQSHWLLVCAAAGIAAGVVAFGVGVRQSGNAGEAIGTAAHLGSAAAFLCAAAGFVPIALARLAFAWRLRDDVAKADEAMKLAWSDLRSTRPELRELSGLRYGAGLFFFWTCALGAACGGCWYAALHLADSAGRAWIPLILLACALSIAALGAVLGLFCVLLGIPLRKIA
jgi:hypothetical protein